MLRLRPLLNRRGCRHAALAFTLITGAGCSGDAPEPEASSTQRGGNKPITPAEAEASPQLKVAEVLPSPAVQEAIDEAPIDSVASLPSLTNRAYVGPLADAYERIDPAKDGWNTEAFHQAANDQLGAFAEQLSDGEWAAAVNALTLAPDFATSPWAPPLPDRQDFDDTQFLIDRLASSDAPLKPAHSGADGLRWAIEQSAQQFESPPKVKVKHYRIQPESTRQVLSRARLEFIGNAPSGGKTQITAEWDLRWTATLVPALETLALAEWEKVTYKSKTKTLFEDRTTALLGRNASFQSHLLRSTDYWRKRLPRNLGLDVVANHGMAVGDVNGDLLDDVYLCMQGGLPNRLYLRQADGTLVDASAESGANWLDYCASALLIDFDNDGDRDLVVGQEWRILFMENDGQAHFELAYGIGTHAQTFALAAADYDNDGDVDVYTCGYNTSHDSVRSGAMGEPLPYHDAQNGGANMLLRNDGNWEFNEATAEVGLDQNNTRFSFAAAWEDYDNDGDLDLYVANDYGRNNLYQNQEGRYRDVAGALGLEDMSSGMSVAWGDHNLDGWMDLYVSNMFSAAGNRITYQRQFKRGVTADTKAIFQRHARGNSLFESSTDGKFRDVSEIADVTMGRWAWGSAFVDFNNDLWQDLVVANGFITAEDTGDL